MTFHRPNKPPPGAGIDFSARPSRTDDSDSSSSLEFDSEQDSLSEGSPEDKLDTEDEEKDGSELEKGPLGWRSRKNADEEELVGSGSGGGRSRKDRRTVLKRRQWLMRSEPSNSPVSPLKPCV